MSSQGTSANAVSEGNGMLMSWFVGVLVLCDSGSVGCRGVGVAAC